LIHTKGHKRNDEMWKSGCFTLERYCEEKGEKFKQKKKQLIVKQEEKILKKIKE